MNARVVCGCTVVTTITRKLHFTGLSTGTSEATGWFTQKASLSGTSTGTSAVAIVTRELVEADSTITLIAEYESGI